MPGFWQSATQALPGAYQQSAANYLRQRMLEQQRQWQLEDQKRQAALQRMKEMAAAAAQRREQHEQFMKGMRQEHQRSVAMEDQMKLINKRLAPYLQSGDLSPEDIEWHMNQVGNLEKPTQAGTYINQVINQIEEKGRDTYENRFNRAMIKYMSGRIGDMSPDEMRMVGIWGGTEIFEPGTMPESVTHPDAIAGGMMEFKKRKALMEAQEKTRKEERKLISAGQQQWNYAKARYQELIKLANQKVPNYDAIEELGGDIVNPDPATFMTFEQWLSTGKRPDTYEKAYELLGTEFKAPFATGRMLLGADKTQVQPTEKQASPATMLKIKQLEEQLRRLEESMP